MANKPQPIPASISILRRPEVEARTGLSRSTIYLKIAQGSFPKSVSLGPRAVGWVASEIDGWLEHQVAASRAASV
jgi:prophage regulatory protein